MCNPASTFEIVFSAALMVLAVAVFIVITVLFVATVVAMWNEWTWTHKDQHARIRRIFTRISRALVTRG